MTFPDAAIMKSLAALSLGVEFVLLDDGHFATGAADWLQHVPSAHVAELDARGWIAFGEDAADGMPDSVTLTEQGRYAVRRYCDKHKIEPRPVRNR